MDLAHRIGNIRAILNSYSPKEINEIYKQYEVDSMIEYFTKYPDVRYSDNMKRRMLREAKRKRITPKRLDFISDMIASINNFNVLEKDDLLIKKTHEWVVKLCETVTDPSKVLLVHIEHSYEPSPQTLQAYSDYDYNNELACFDIYYDLDSIWGFTTKHKFKSLSESLEGFMIEDEEYILLFEEVYKLLSYQKIQNTLNSKEQISLIQQTLNNPRLVIRFGQHDNWVYNIFGENYPHENV